MRNKIKCQNIIELFEDNVSRQSTLSLSEFNRICSKNGFNKIDHDFAKYIVKSSELPIVESDEYDEPVWEYDETISDNNDNICSIDAINDYIDNGSDSISNDEYNDIEEMLSTAAIAMPPMISSISQHVANKRNKDVDGRQWFDTPSLDDSENKKKAKDKEDKEDEEDEEDEEIKENIAKNNDFKIVYHNTLGLYESVCNSLRNNKIKNFDNIEFKILCGDKEVASFKKLDEAIFNFEDMLQFGNHNKIKMFIVSEGHNIKVNVNKLKKRNPLMTNDGVLFKSEYIKNKYTSTLLEHNIPSRIVEHSFGYSVKSKLSQTQIANIVQKMKSNN